MANSALGGSFSYSAALAELDEVKRRSRLMAPGGVAGCGAATSSPPFLARGGGFGADMSEAVPPSVHPWEVEDAWHDMGVYAKVGIGRKL